MFVSNAFDLMKFRISWKFIWLVIAISMKKTFCGNDFRLNYCHDIRENCCCNQEILKWWILITRRLCKASRHRVEGFLPFTQCWITVRPRLHHLRLTCRFQIFHQVRNHLWTIQHLLLRHTLKRSWVIWERANRGIYVSIAVNSTRENMDWRFTSEHTQVGFISSRFHTQI